MNHHIIILAMMLLTLPGCKFESDQEFSDLVSISIDSNIQKYLIFKIVNNTGENICVPVTQFDPLHNSMLYKNNVVVNSIEYNTIGIDNYNGMDISSGLYVIRPGERKFIYDISLLDIHGGAKDQEIYISPKVVLANCKDYFTNSPARIYTLVGKVSQLDSELIN